MKLEEGVNTKINSSKLLPTKEELTELLNCESDIEEEAKYYEEHVAPTIDTSIPTTDMQGTLEETKPTH